MAAYRLKEKEFCMRKLAITLFAVLLSVVTAFAESLDQADTSPDTSTEVDTCYTTTAVAGDVLFGKTFITRTAGHGDRGVTGTIPTQTLSSSSTVVNAGYYAATTLDAIDPDLTPGNIKSGVTIFGITGSYKGKDYAYGIPKTGQNISYEEGDDGYYKKGAPASGPRFTDNKDGTITDNATGLMWVQSGYADADTRPATAYKLIPEFPWRLYTWENAILYCNRLNDKTHFPPNGYLGHSDWRLPNINELYSIANYSHWYTPALRESSTCAPFTNNPHEHGLAHFISSTSRADYPDMRWGVDTFAGSYTLISGDCNYVRPVRDSLSADLAVPLNQGALSQPTSLPDNSTEVDINYTTTATAPDVLAGKTFITSITEKGYRGVAGTMPTQTLSTSSTTINTGYYEATTLEKIDPDLISGNIKSGVNIFGINGTCTSIYAGKDYGLPKTGQTASYYEGDDGYYKKGAPASGPRFTDNKDGTITDNATGLMWVQSGYADANTFPFTPYTANGLWRKYTWQNAVFYCNQLNDKTHFPPNGYLGYSDWRLPNINELRSIINYGNWRPAIGEATVGGNSLARDTDQTPGTGTPFTNTMSFHYFTNPKFIIADQNTTQNTSLYPAGGTGHYQKEDPTNWLGPCVPIAIYWSSTTSAGYTNTAWHVDFNGTDISPDPKTWLFYVRPVRGGE